MSVTVENSTHLRQRKVSGFSIQACQVAIDFEGESRGPIPTAPARTRNHARIFWAPFRRLARIKAMSIGPREKAPALAFSVRLRK